MNSPNLSAVRLSLQYKAPVYTVKGLLSAHIETRNKMVVIQKQLHLLWFRPPTGVNIQCFNAPLNNYNISLQSLFRTFFSITLVNDALREHTLSR